MSDDFKNLIERAIKTFIQGVLAYILVATQQGTEIQLDITLILGAVGAGLSALMNLTQSYLPKKKKK